MTGNINDLKRESFEEVGGELGMRVIVKHGDNWKPPVTDNTELPTTDNVIGDIRQALDTGIPYRWNGTAWVVWITGGGSGDVVGPASAIADNIAVFNSTTGKLIKDGGKKISDLIPITQNALTKEPTGFTVPEDVIVTGDAGSRTITLTGTVEAYYQGVVVSELVTGWESDPHDDTAGSNFFLAYDGTDFVWYENSFPGFDKVLIAFGLWDASNTTWIYNREPHGLMKWETHKEFHETIGTYKTAGGTIPSASYTLNSTTATNRRPDIDETTIYDEDLPSVLPALTSELYTKMSLGNASTSLFTVETAEIIALSTNNPYYNTFASPNWGQTLMPANSVATVWVYAMPVCAGTACQKYRYFFVQPQWITQATNSSAGALLTALNAEKLRLPSELNLGSLGISAPEFVAIGRIAITYTGGNWSLSSVQLLTGNKYSQIGSPSGNFLSTVETDATLTGNGTPASPLSVPASISGLVGTKEVDETDIADTKILVYNSTTGKLEYETPSGGSTSLSDVQISNRIFL